MKGIEVLLQSCGAFHNFAVADVYINSDMYSDGYQIDF